ncbi:Mannosyl-oligosaccharide glucosidase GCS1 [Sesamum angolense]|uniref:Mannosyl-oligosaccharide glucosidase n=1 Tax=Sesamum angolense TaxID=2727404 RepID=A0AAE1X048_9LAMI|nr:Mannosyl-oligosaccharide glucosidase GCS1 [Sesamum angolense]
MTRISRRNPRANPKPLRMAISHLLTEVWTRTSEYPVAGTNYSVNSVKKSVRPRVVTPLPAPKLMDLSMFEGEHKESLYWGTYRPHVYFGIRASLMWIGVKDGRYFMRHVCQDSDELKTYGWTHHNGRDYGHQVLVDQNLKLTTSFLKSMEKESSYGGDWAVRIEAKSEIPYKVVSCDNAGNPTACPLVAITRPSCVYRKVLLKEEMENTVHLFFYVAEEGGNALHLGSGRSDIPDVYILAFGSRNDLGSWQLHLESKTNLGVQARKVGRLQLSDTSDDAPNILVFQISAMIPFKADIAFVSTSSGSSSRTEDRVRSLIGDSLTGRLEQKQKQFDDKFKRCFNISDELNSDAITVGKAALGICWEGLATSMANLKFHCHHPLKRWDVRISLDIIGHWLDLMNADGWIPREQILGAEALSKVPLEFVLQHPTNGNPPTLFLVLRDLVCGIKKNKFTASEKNDISTFLRQAFVRLDAWFKWFNTTQSGKDANTYYWHGRDSVTTRELNPKSLSSGLDDYPRASHPSEDERHLDLRCWMHLAADCMSSIADILDDSDIGKEYGLTANLLSDFELLNQMHFDYNNGAYFDYGNHTEKVRLSWRLVEAAGNHPTRELVREVLEKPVLRLVPHIGYVSLFPFMSRLIPPDSWILEKQLDLISNTSTLWTNFGLRSLAKTSSIYMQRNTEHDPPYWRGPIWMNMNYMILSALNYYSEVDGPYRDKAKTIYNDLRNNLIRNVVRNYNETGYLWEQYDQKKGKGKGARLFTGWTSLTVLIMAEAYAEC